MNLENIFTPESVALIGASREKGHIGHEILLNLMESFSGEIYPVNPHAERIAGIRCYSRIEELPRGVDLAVVAIPARLVVDILRQCSSAGIKDAIVISAGFEEVGEEGKKRGRELAQLSREEDMNVIGPNSLGVISTKVGLNATFADRMALPGNLSFMSQSGAFCTAVLDWASEMNIGFNGFVSLGNKTVIDEVDLIRAWGNDPETEVILAYLEGIKEGRRFMEVAREIVPHTPVVLIKSGRTEEGSRAVSSHTGTLAGTEAAYDAAFRQSGVIRAENVEELFDFAALLAAQEPPRGESVGVVTNAGGPGVMATDALEEYGLELAKLKEETLSSLEEVLSPLANRRNPVDLTGDADEEDYRRVLHAVLEDENVDALIALSAPAAIISYPCLTEVIAEAKRKYDKPLVSCLMGGEMAKEARDNLATAGVMNYFDPARATRSLGALCRYGRFRRRSWPGPRDFDRDRGKAKDMLREMGGEDGWIGPEGLKLLKEYGIPVVRSLHAGSPEEALAAAGKLKQAGATSLVLKVDLAGGAHKSELGGVEVGIEPGQAEEVYRRVSAEVASKTGRDRLRGVFLQPQVEGRELIVGFRRDRQFGPLITFGYGGVYVEIFEDVSFRVAPLSRAEARSMIEEVRAYPLLEGVRGEEGVDLDALTEVLEKLSLLALDLPGIQELDVNPLFASAAGVVAVDFRARVR